MKANIDDNIVAELDFNFNPGDLVHGVTTSPSAVGVCGLVLSVDHNAYKCYVMWTLPEGAVRFTSTANFNLRHA